MSKVNDYWRKREEEALRRYITDEREYDKQVKKIYADMLDACQQEIDSFYGKYAATEGISIAEAQRRVSRLDIEAYERKARRYIEEKNFSDFANREMRLYNATMKINRLEMLKANIGLGLISGHDKLDKFMGTILKGRTNDELSRQAGILGKSIRGNAKAADNIVNASFHNATYSQRVWANQGLLKNKLSSILQTGLIQGKNPRALARELQKTFGASVYDSERLMRTELARVQTDAQKKSFEANGYDEYEFIANSGCCSVCQCLNGKHFKVEKMMPGENAAPLHPNCRCSVAAYMDDKEYEDWLDFLDKGGTTKEWKKWEKYVATSTKSGTIIPKDKFIKYALDPVNVPDKAIAFKKELGYDLTNGTDLVKNLDELIDQTRFIEKGFNGYGMTYEYIVEMAGPNGKKAGVLTAWIQLSGEEKKRLTSVYVTEKRRTK